MKLSALFALASFLLPLTAHATPADEQFESTAKAYIEQTLEHSPEWATALGDHRFDSKLTDYSPDAFAKARAAAQDSQAKLAKIDREKLTGPNKVDAQILKDAIDYQLFRLNELKEWESDPLIYNESLANSLYLLVARDFAPAKERIENLRSRMEAIPAVIVQAKANLQHPAEINTQVAIDQTQGAISLVKDGLAPLLDQAPELKKELAPLQEKTAAALADYKIWLEKDLLPRSTGDFRLGAKLFRQKLHFALASDMPMEEVMTRAEADLKATQAALYETALPLYKQFVPNADPATFTDQRFVTTSVLDQLAKRHPDNDTIVDYSKKAVGEATAFVRRKDFVTVPEEPLDVIVMPEFKRGADIAYCDSPGPLEKNAKTFFAIEPTPKNWSEARRESFFREYNNYMVHDLTVHEAMPGHYLQLVHSNQFKAPTLVRAMFQSGSMIEGWAVYMEQKMAEEGFGGPEVKMEQLKMRLRVIVNAIIDQKIHAGKMTEKEAIDLMEKEGFQQEGEAVAKWKRARISSSQLSTYFIGVSEWLDLRTRAQANAGKEFDVKKFNDTALSFGSPPVKYIRELMGL